MTEVNGAVLGMEPENDQVLTDSIREQIESPDVRANQQAQRWTPECGSQQCEAESDGTRCLLIEHHEDSVNATPHLFTAIEVEEFDASELTDEQIKNGLMNLSGGVATPQEVENAARSEEGLPPVEQELPLDFGPFNPDNALKVIFEKSAEITELQADYDEKKEAASDAKKALDKANTALVNIIESFKKRRQQALNPSQPYLAEVADGGLPKSAKSGCPTERAGKRCIVCEEARAAKLAPAAESEVHPEHEGHEAVSRRAFEVTVLTPLITKLQDKNVHMTFGDLNELDADQLQSLIDWVDQSGVVPPAILATSHVAAAPGTMAQGCLNCDTSLAFSTDEDGFYPERALVGFDCETKIEQVVREAEAGPAEPAKEAAVRKPRSHAKKTATKKREPEKDRADQVEAGRKASAKEPKRTAKKTAKKGKR